MFKRRITQGISIVVSFTTCFIFQSPVFGQTRITFPRGSYCGSYEGPSRVYILGLQAGQIFEVQNIDQQVEYYGFEVIEKSTGLKLPIVSLGEFDTHIETRIPSTGDYIVRASSDHWSYYAVRFCAYTPN